jgi:hypothetical protein
MLFRFLWLLASSKTFRLVSNIFRFTSTRRRQILHKAPKGPVTDIKLVKMRENLKMKKYGTTVARVWHRSKCGVTRTIPTACAYFGSETLPRWRTKRTLRPVRYGNHSKPGVARKGFATIGIKRKRL